MRRERIIAGLAVFIALVGLTALTPGRASAASPSEICADLADGQLNGSYSQADLTAYLTALRSDPTIQGYCSPLVIVTQCTEVPAGTPGAQQAPNGKWYTNAPNGNAAACGSPPAPCTEVPAGTPGAVQAANGTWYANAPNGNAAACVHTTAPCIEVAAGTAGAQQAPNGKWYVNAPNGNAAACAEVAGTATTTTTPAAAVVPATTTTTGVLGSTKTKTAQPAAPATETVAAPLASTRTAPTGTLPFTGAQLGIFAVVGAALLAGGLLLRASARKQRTDG